MQVKMIFPGGELNVGGAQAPVPAPHVEYEAGRLRSGLQARGWAEKEMERGTGGELRPSRPSLPTSQLSSNQISATSLLLYLPPCTLIPYLSLWTTKALSTPPLHGHPQSEINTDT